MAIKEPIYRVEGKGNGTIYTTIGYREVPAEDEVHIAPTPIVYERKYPLDAVVSWTVDFDWSAVGVDRPNTGGISTGPGERGRKLAERLAAATRAGAVHYDAYVNTDTAGQTYVASKSRVMGKYLNADLKRLGF